ncbi:protein TRIGALACTOSYLDIACYLGLYCEROL 4, chloroplastic-like isoform X1 [Silene latifolia]|uniref:protein TRIGALACTOSYLDIACYLGLYCEROL 4, chloroplastic-like isoform X1 n=1 Tax=Silene latifolia TaxID=37657 RepID=UPI003D770A11
MATMSTPMDQQLSSPVNLNGWAKPIPGDPFPFNRIRSERAPPKVHQLSLLKNGLPEGIIPCFDTFALQSLLLSHSFGNLWVGLIGQFRPKMLLSNIKTEFTACEGNKLSALMNIGIHFLDKSLYSLGLCTQIPITSSSSLFFSSEAHGGRNGLCNKLVLFHKLLKHDITVDAAWPELYVDRYGKYWNVPESISVDLASDVSESALHYRLGLQKNGGRPLTVINTVETETPAALLPGLYAKGSFSYQTSKDLWRIKETQDDLIVQTEPAYDAHLREPRATISAIVGGSFRAWLWQGNEDSSEVSSIQNVNPFVANVSATLSCTFQHGKFRNKYRDLTRINARLHFPSLSGFARSISDNRQDNPASLPRLRLTFLQQVVGPLVFRIATKHVVHSPWRNGMEAKDVILGLSYSFHLLRSGRVTVRYSPMKHKCKIRFEF